MALYASLTRQSIDRQLAQAIDAFITSANSLSEVRLRLLEAYAGANSNDGGGTPARPDWGSSDEERFATFYYGLFNDDGSPTATTPSEFQKAYAQTLIDKMVVVKAVLDALFGQNGTALPIDDYIAELRGLAFPAKPNGG